MQNLLIVGGEDEDRLRRATHLILLEFCSAQNKPCQQCEECIRIKHRTHPNVLYVDPPSGEDDESGNIEAVREIGIEQVRKITEEIGKKSFEKSPMVFVFSAMHLLTKAAANALLKAIEEHPENKYFFALAPSRMTVLPTIASRLVMHKVAPLATVPKENLLNAMTKVREISKTTPSKRWPWLSQFPTTKSELILEIQMLLEANHQLIEEVGLAWMASLKLGDALSESLISAKMNRNPKLIVENLILNAWPHISPQNAK